VVGLVGEQIPPGGDDQLRGGGDGEDCDGGSVQGALRRLG
jgi:hypothetical protein